MAEANAPSLGDFFKSKGKKKIKASNLNKAEATKTEEKKVKTSAEDDAWEEEQVVASTMKVEVVGKLVRDEDKKEEEDTAAPAWGNVAKGNNNSINEKRFPTLAKANAATSINIDDGSDAKVNITTSKNHFAALEGEADDDEDAGAKRPKNLKPAMISKKQGEFEKVAVQREVQKYKKQDEKKKKKAEKEENDEEESDEESEEEAEKPVEEESKKPKKAVEKKDEKKAKKPTQEEEGPQSELEEDLKILVDLEASKEKYKGRKKLEPKDVPRSELQEQKEEKAKVVPSGKKKKFVCEEETEKKIAYADWDQGYLALTVDIVGATVGVRFMRRLAPEAS